MGADPLESIDRILDIAREFVRMDIAFVSRWHDDVQEFAHVSGESSTFGVTVGGSLPLDGSFCVRVMDGRIRSAVPDASAEPEVRDLAVTHAARLGSYVGVPVRFSDGDFFGMLCCVSHEASQELGPRDVRFLEMISDLVAERLELDRAERQQREDIERRTNGAIAAEAFDVYLQPIVRLADLTTVGYEALARFHGALARTPDVWFNESASVGLGPALDLAVVGTALRTLSSIPAGVYLSVNVTPETLGDRRLATLLQPYGRRLVVEVTEHAEIEDYRKLAHAAAPIRARGVRLAVDDAGAGFATFRHIVQLAPDIIKADITLTRGVDHDPARRALVRALVGFAQDTSAILVSEGVETKAERDTLMDLGVTVGQGYLLGRPAPPNSWFGQPPVSRRRMRVSPSSPVPDRPTRRRPAATTAVVPAGSPT